MALLTSFKSGGEEEEGGDIVSVAEYRNGRRALGARGGGCSSV